MFTQIFLILLCIFIGFKGAAEIYSKDFLNLLNAPPRYISLKDNGLVPKQQKVHPSLKIVKGEPASRGQFCYSVYLQFTDGRSYWSCGGSLVTDRIILTAAHCVEGATKAVAVLGALDLSQYREPGRVIVGVPSSGLKVHEKYDQNKIYNDIGLVIMNKSVQLSNYICTVKIRSCSSSRLTADSDNKNDYTVCGWGKTSDRSTSSRLMYVNVSGEAQSSCANYYKYNANYQVIQTQICTSGSGGKSTCNGDSGGPLVQPDTTGSLIQQGIVSLGMSSCEMSAPSVYTDLRFFMTWLCPQLNLS